MGDIKKLSIIEYKKYLDAINKREVEIHKMNAIIFRASTLDQKNFNNFIESFDNNKKSDIVLSEKGMQNIGYGRKK